MLCLYDAYIKPQTYLMSDPTATAAVADGVDNNFDDDDDEVRLYCVA